MHQLGATFPRDGSTWCVLSALTVQGLDVKFVEYRVKAVAPSQAVDEPAPIAHAPSSLLRASLRGLDSEVTRSRTQFPSARNLLASLTHEVGLLAHAVLQREGRSLVGARATTVAAVAMRICEEGDPALAERP